MALEIAKKSQYGVTVTYWKITKISVDWLNKKASIILSGFSSKEARDVLADPLIQNSFYFEEVLGLDNKIEIPFPFNFNDNITAVAYELIKGRSEFKEAIDC